MPPPCRLLLPMLDDAIKMTQIIIVNFGYNLTNWYLDIVHVYKKVQSKLIKIIVMIFGNQ